MGYDIHSFFAHEKMSFEQSLSYFYKFIKEAKEISTMFSKIYFTANSLEDALRKPLPEDEEDFYKKIKERISTYQILDETMTSFRLGAPIEGTDKFLSLSFNHSDSRNCNFRITYVKSTRCNIERSRNIFDNVIASLITNFPVQYLVENYISNAAAWYELKLAIGWSICAATEDIGRIQGFPSYEIAPGFTRVAAVAEVFDVSNPVHVERTQELEREIESNSRFVKRRGFINVRKSRKG